MTQLQRILLAHTNTSGDIEYSVYQVCTCCITTDTGIAVENCTRCHGTGLFINNVPPSVVRNYRDKYKIIMQEH